MGESDHSSADEMDFFAAKKRRLRNASRMEANKKNVARKSTAKSSESANQARRSDQSSPIARAPSNSEDSGDDFLTSTGLSPDKPSTSRVLRSRNSQWTDHESESGSETPDSDEIPVLDKSRKKAKKKPQKKPAAKPQPVQKLPPAPKPTSAQKLPKKMSSVPQNSQKGQSKKVLSPVKNKEAFEQLVNKCVYYLLITDKKKYIIRKQAIIEHVFKDQNCNTSLYKDVISAAGRILKQTFGFELLCDKDQKDAYMIVNVLKPELEVHELSEYSRLNTQQRGLLLFLLTVIFMNENVISEEELWKALKPLGIDAQSRKPHPVFGDVRKFVGTELVRQMYLESRSVERDPPRAEFSWGKRALQEVDRRELLEFACKIMKDTRPEDWVMQFKEAQEAAGENREEETD